MKHRRGMLLFIVAAFAATFGSCGILAIGVVGGSALGYGTLATTLHLDVWPFTVPYGPGDYSYNLYEDLVVQGALVTDVAPASPAFVAGILPDDIIVAVDGEIIDAYYDLRDALGYYVRGDSLTLTVLTGADSHDVEVSLSPSPTDSGDAYLGIRYVMFGTLNSIEITL